tara:strand:+ start:38 stop:382 length:345 start_codon:yes stop_codon:yes gene_type:complete
MELQIITKKLDFINIINNNEYVIVYCGLTFCAPCNKIYPIYEDLVNQYPNITFCKIILDTLDDESDTYIRDFLKLSKFPTFTLLNNGIILDSFMGPYNDKLINMVQSISGDDDF